MVRGGGRGDLQGLLYVLHTEQTGVVPAAGPSELRTLQFSLVFLLLLQVAKANK